MSIQEIEPADIWNWIVHEVASTGRGLDFDTALEMVLDRCKTHHRLEEQIMNSLNPCN